MCHYRTQISTLKIKLRGIIEISASRFRLENRCDISLITQQMAAALKSSRVAIECAIRRGCCKLPQATPAVCKCLSRCMSSPSSCETGSHVHNDKSETRDCWSCGQCINKFNLFCGSCEYIQPLDGKINFFQLLQL